MIVRFQWQPGEWREAYLLSTSQRVRAPGAVPMGYLLLGLTALSGVGDLLRTLRNNRATIEHESLLPMLGLVCGLSLLVTLALTLVRRRSRMRGLPTVPAGEQQVILHELGWSTADTAGDSGEPVVRAWSELRGQRIGHRVLTLITRDGGTVAVPLRALTEEQGGRLERLLLRKVPNLA